MNLLVISNNFPDKNDGYIGDIFVKEQLRALRKYFDTIYVISPKPFGIELFRKAHQEDYNFDNIQVFFPSFLTVPLFYFKYRKIWLLLAKRAVLRKIKEQNLRFDLIHAHYTWPSGVIGIELGKIFKVPIIVTEHTSRTFEKAIKKRDSLYAKTWKSCSAIIRVRKGDIKKIVSLGVPEHKIFHIPNGFDSKEFSVLDRSIARTKLGLPCKKRIMISIGNLLEVKGHKYLIDAMPGVISQKSDVLCLIVGSGPLTDKLQKQIRELGVEDHVKLVGAKSHNEIPLWLNASDLFVLPSLSEGNPTVMFEALGCGVPFVGTKVGGVPEVITSEDYGLLCEPGNADDLAEKILIALDKKWDREKIRRYAEQFTWDNVTKQVMAVYESVLNK